MLKYFRKYICITAAFFAGILSAIGQDGGGKPGLKEIVFPHLGDTYGWHVVSFTPRKSIVLPLPVVVRGHDGEWHRFSSSRLEGGSVWHGFALAGTGKYEGKVVELTPGGEWRRPLDLSLTKTGAALLVNTLLLIIVVSLAVRGYRRNPLRAPRGITAAVEMLTVEITEGVIRPCVGEGHYRRYAPFLLTLFFFILTNNLMGVVPFFPGGANTTGNITVTLVLAVATFLVVNLSGSREYWKEIFNPDVPSWMKLPLPLMPAIELLGVFTKPFALMIRLFANVLAGHSIALGLTCLVFATVSMGRAINVSMSAVAVLLGVFMILVEVLVAFLQAYVFTMLSSIFIGMSKVGR